MLPLISLLQYLQYVNNLLLHLVIHLLPGESLASLPDISTKISLWIKTRTNPLPMLYQNNVMQQNLNNSYLLLTELERSNVIKYQFPGCSVLLIAYYGNFLKSHHQFLLQMEPTLVSSLYRIWKTTNQDMHRILFGDIMEA